MIASNPFAAPSRSAANGCAPSDPEAPDSLVDLCGGRVRQAADRFTQHGSDVGIGLVPIATRAAAASSSDTRPTLGGFGGVVWFAHPCAACPTAVAASNGSREVGAPTPEGCLRSDRVVRAGPTPVPGDPNGLRIAAPKTSSDGRKISERRGTPILRGQTARRLSATRTGEGASDVCPRHQLPARQRRA